MCRTRESGLAPDLFLLDVYMPEMLGTETARKLRDMGSVRKEKPENEKKLRRLVFAEEYLREVFGT